MDRVYGASRAQSSGSLNLGRRLDDLWLRLGCPLDLISIVGLHMDNSGRVSFLGFIRPTHSTEVPWLPAWELKLELRCTTCDEFSSCVIYATRGIQFAHLPRWKRLRESRRRESGSGGLQWKWGRHPAVLRLQGLLRQRRRRRGLLLQEMNRRGRPWQGGSTTVDG
jgi:hypothetical protein